MKSTSGKRASNEPIKQMPLLRRPLKLQKVDTFYEHLQHIWNKVILLQDIVLIENESDKFNYAYRFAEIELEKVCKENASLQQKINELLANQQAAPGNNQIAAIRL